MTLNDISLIAQIVSGALGVASLIVLIVSIRQNTRAQLALSVESLTAAIMSINVPAMQSPALGEALAAVREDWWGATREQRIIANYFLFSFYKLIEQAWYQHKSGVLHESQWAGWEVLLTVYAHSPGIASTWWPKRQHAYSRDFRAYIGETTKSHEVGELSDIFGPADNGNVAPCRR